MVRDVTVILIDVRNVPPKLKNKRWQAQRKLGCRSCQIEYAGASDRACDMNSPVFV